MKYQYTITHKTDSKPGRHKFKSFKTKHDMLNFLTLSANRLSKLNSVKINFKSVSLNLKETVWR